MKLDGARLLILEDEPIIAFGLEDMLLDEGAQVSLATALDEAEDHLAGGSFDCAILDVNVRGEKSYGFAEALKDRGIRFIFATGYGEGAHPDEFMDVPTITKPYSIEQIRDTLARLA